MKQVERADPHRSGQHANAAYLNKVIYITGNNRIVFSVIASLCFTDISIKKILTKINSSSCEQQETEVAYETERNDTEVENIEVDEPVIQKVRGSYVKQEIHDDASDPLYTEDYLDASPKRKSPTKKQSTIQNGELAYFKNFGKCTDCRFLIYNYCITIYSF